MNDYAVIGGGIIGISTALHLLERFPGARVVILEKEAQPALHQTGRNSGVIHSGIYYTPGSFKARFARAGADSMVAFCREYGLPYDVCGKIIVATRPEESAPLEKLHQRGLQNGVPVQRISPEQAREIEPHVACLEALSVPSTGITDYKQVCAEMLRQIAEKGGELKLNHRIEHLHRDGNAWVMETPAGEVRAAFIVNCAGLFNDRIARLAGANPPARIVPFRGEYFELVPERRHLVKTLIYPVPNPDFPFLGVHFTRMIDGSIHAGPNAVLAFAREGYFKRNLNLRDLGETLRYAGFWKLARKNLGEGVREMVRSFSKQAFTRSLQALIPEVRREDLLRCKAGIRAQALLPDGKMVDDFLFLPGPNALHVCNAPSPGATASLEIGREVAGQVPDLRTTTVSGATT